MLEGESRKADLKEERQRKRRNKEIITRCVVALVIISIIVGIVILCIDLYKSGFTFSSITDALRIEVSSSNTIIDSAKILAEEYDYDGAIEKLKTIKGYEGDSKITNLISDYEKERDACVSVDVTKVPHVFFHSLIYDYDMCFNNGHLSSLLDGFNAWMITCEEFQETIEQLYAEGYVIINVSDIYTQNADGTLLANTNLKLPADKKALIVSYDDPCYYCSYEGWGIADGLILDDSGKLTNTFTDSNGNQKTGSFDHMTMLIDYCEEHPDFTYHGHKGTLALTGYDGILGYRTEPRMFTNPTSDEKAWLEHHPDITYDKIDEYKVEATKVAAALKEQGFEFASHTWGHINCATCSMDELKQDTEWFKENVESIVGDVNILIYPHGEDIAGAEDYSSNNEKYEYIKSMGYKIFCNIDRTKTCWNQFGSNYIRQSRIDIDGYSLYENIQGNNNVLINIGLDCEKIFDKRRPQPVVIP